MKIYFFELFSVLAFSFIAYLCYNLFVAHTVTTRVLLESELKQVVFDRFRIVNSQLRDMVEKEEDVSLGEKELSTEGLVRQNEKTLSELLVDTATESDYDLYLDEVTTVIQDLYKNYQFVRQDPAPGDYRSGYYLGFVFYRGEYAVAYEQLFRLAIDKGLDPIKINSKFVERVEAGSVLALGDAIIDPLQTGISSILQGQEVRVSISFAPTAYEEKKKELIAKKVEEDKVKEEERKAKAKQLDDIVNEIRVTQGLLRELTDEVAEKYDLQQLVDKLRESMGYL